MELLDKCLHLIPDNEDKEFTTELIRNADLNSNYDDEELYFAHVKVLEDYVYADRIGEMRRILIEHWKETEEERERQSY